MYHMLEEKDDEILEQSKLMEMLEKEVNKCRLVIGQHRAKMKMLNETIRQSNAKRRNLEEELDRLQEQVYEGKRAMTKNNHDPGKLDLNSGGAGGQVEQVAAKPSLPSLPVPYPSVNEVLEDQTAVEAPCWSLGRRSPGCPPTPSPPRTTTTLASLTSTPEELVDRWSRRQ